MIWEILRPQVCYRLQDLADWLSLPTEELFFAAQRGEVRSLGEGHVNMTVLGADVIEFAKAHRLHWGITPEGRRALGPIDADVECWPRMSPHDASEDDERTDADDSPAGEISRESAA